jgi:glycosyltransferase involved in cell wall biosynthesis
LTRLFQAMAGARHGGAELFFTRLAVALQANGVDQRVAIRRDPARRAALERGGVAVEEHPFGGRLDWRTRRALARSIAEFAPDVVLTWMNRATRLCPRATKARPFVHVARLGGYYDLKYYRACDHLAGNTPAIVDYLIEQGWPADRAHYLPNFVPATKAPPQPRAALETPDDAPLLLALGRLHANKAFDVLLDALAELPGHRLWLAGEGPEREALQAQAARLGVADRVRFLGWRDDTAALLAAADILVCPSRHEPLGNVVIEAWAQDRPVVAAAAAGPAHLIEDGVTGLLVPVEDAPALAAACREALGTRGAALAAAGAEAYRAGYTEDAVVARYRAFFEAVAG